MHFKRRYKIYLCSVILGQLESFRNCMGFSIIFRSFRCSLKCYESKNFSVLLRTDILQKAVVGFPLFPPRSFLFSSPYPWLVWFWSLSGPKKLPFDAFSLEWRQISRGWFSKKRLDVSKEFCRSFKVRHFEVANDISGHLASTLLILQNRLAGFLKTLSPNGPFPSNSFFRPKTTSKVVIIKTMKATIAFSPSPSFCLHALSFSPFLFFVRLVSKNRLDTQT